MMKKVTFLIIGLIASFLFLEEKVSGQKIFPGAVGFGTEHRGAYENSESPEILIVDTLFAGILQTSENSGSFEWCITQNYPRIVIFEVGGVIDYTNTNRRYMYINNPYLNVYGQTAPSPGITLLSMNLYVNSHDMLFQHLKFRFGDKPMPNGNYMAGDCLTIFEGGYNVVVDHCSFSWSQDELIGDYGSNTTFSNNLMYEPLVYSVHADEGGEHMPEPHGFGPLVSIQGNFTFINNFLGWTIARNPHLVASTFVNANNFVYSAALLGPDVSGNNGVVNGCMVGNVNYPTEEQNDEKSEYAIYLRESVPTTSRLYFNDNLCIRKEQGFSDVENIFTYLNESDLNSVIVPGAAGAGIDLSEYNILPSEDVEQYIINNSGARFWDRDYYDAMAIEKLINRQQDFISSPDSLPARVYNRSRTEGWRTRDGNMENGYDFSANPVSFTVNGQTISLSTNLTSQSAVLSAINAQMPSGTVAVDHPHPLCTHIILQTVGRGSDQTITVAGDDLAIFGIYPGTYRGTDGAGGYPDYPPTYTVLDIPVDPHGDDNSNGYTNIEEWVYGLGNQEDTCRGLNVYGAVENCTSGQNDGAIDITILGGTPPYSSIWSDNTSNLDRDNLSVGDYSIIITDNVGCVKERQFTIHNDEDNSGDDDDDNDSDDDDDDEDEDNDDQIPLFSIYPNPTSEIFNVSISENDEGVVKVYDIYGTKLLDKPLNRSNEQIKVDFPTGIYIVKVFLSGNKMFSKKLIVN